MSSSALPPADVAPGDLWLAGCRVGVRFFFRADRYAHQIYVANDAAWRAVLESLEGTPDEAWPSSPPFQSATSEHKPEGPVILLVGMAGKSHWSASVELEPADGQIRFDVACRAMHSPKDALGSCYRGLGAVIASEIGLKVIGGPGSHVSHAVADEKSVTISCAKSPAAGSGKQTLRWSYAFRAATSSPS
ncbi:MAG TPA: hypothetical protein VL175_09660 [Pirellulales bacterium]|nr:hypothetical protein [Pirellulales bacterium]